jgi:hypothetical protein
VKTTISHLLTLQDLELQTSKKRSSKVEALRTQIPAAILARFDRFIGRGKKGVALVENSICKGCQIALPIGVVNGLIHGKTAEVCGNCGRYLYLTEADAAAFQAGRRADTIIVVPKAKVPSLATKTVRSIPKASKRKVATLDSAVHMTVG